MTTFAHQLNSPHQVASPDSPSSTKAASIRSPFLQGSPGASSTSSLPAGAAPAFPLRRLQQHATGTERVTYAEEQRQLAAQERRTSPLPAIPSLEGAGSGGQSSGRTRQLLTRRADDHPLEPPTASPEPSLFHSHSTLGNCTQHSSATQQHPRALASPLQASSRRDLSHDASTHDSQPNTSRPPPSHFYNSLTPSQRIARGGQSELSPEPSSRSGNIFGIGGVPAHQSRREDDRAPPPPNKSAPRQETSSSRRPAAPPVTPPPKRSFFGLGGKISAPKPPPSHSKPASSTLQKSRALPSAHARRSSGGEIGRSLSSTPVRSSATAAYRTSQSVGRTTTRPDRNTVAETWVVLDAREPTDQLPPVPPHQRLSRFPQRSHEPRGNGSQTPPPHRASARDPSTGFASPPFYAASPRTSDSHGSFESGADLQRIRSLGDARDWSWNQTLEGYQGPRSGTPVHSREGTQESLEEARAEVVVRPARRSSLMPMGAERVEYATSPPGRASSGFVSPERVANRKDSSLGVRREVLLPHAEIDSSPRQPPQPVLSNSSSYSTLTGMPSTPDQPASSATYSPMSAFLGNSPNSSLHATPPRASHTMSPTQQEILRHNSLVAGRHGRVAPTHPAAVRRPLDSDSDESSIRSSVPLSRAGGLVEQSSSRPLEEERALSAPLPILTTLDTIAPTAPAPALDRFSTQSNTDPVFILHPADLLIHLDAVETSTGTRSPSPVAPSSTRPSGEHESARTTPSSVEPPNGLSVLEARDVVGPQTEVEEQSASSRSSRPSSLLASGHRLPSLAGAALSSPILLEDASVLDEIAQVDAIEAEEEDDQARPRFEFALVIYPDRILVNLLQHLSYQDYRSLRAVSKTMLRCIEGDAKELVLQRFLGPVGYRTLPTAHFSSHGTHLSSHNVPLHRSTSTTVREDTVVLDLRDLDAFQIGMEYTVQEYALFAREHAKEPLGLDTLRMVRASTRAFNRIVIRIRAQHVGPLARLPRPPYAFPRVPNAAPVYKSGRAALLRVWVPAKKSWLADEEVVETEREVWRSGVWTHLKRGDIVHDVAVGDFGNEGKLIYDGKYLRDFQFTYDLIGHLPPWLDMLAFPPGYYHNIVASSTTNPVFYASLNAGVNQIRETLALCDEKVQVSSPQGSYQIKRFVYRGSCRLKAGTIIGGSGGAGGSGPGGVDIVHEDWSGTVVVETDGTTEHATTLIARCSSTVPTPWRILRDKSRPGKLWLRPVLDDERTS